VDRRFPPFLLLPLKCGGWATSFFLFIELSCSFAALSSLPWAWTAGQPALVPSFLPSCKHCCVYFFPPSPRCCKVSISFRFSPSRNVLTRQVPPFSSAAQLCPLFSLFCFFFFPSPLEIEPSLVFFDTRCASGLSPPFQIGTPGPFFFLKNIKPNPPFSGGSIGFPSFFSRRAVGFKLLRFWLCSSLTALFFFFRRKQTRALFLASQNNAPLPPSPGGICYRPHASLFSFTHSISLFSHSPLVLALLILTKNTEAPFPPLTGGPRMAERLPFSLCGKRNCESFVSLFHRDQALFSREQSAPPEAQFCVDLRLFFSCSNLSNASSQGRVLLSTIPRRLSPFEFRLNGCSLFDYSLASL